MTQLRVILAVLLRPATGFEDLRRRPRALLAVLLLMATAALSHAAISSRLDEDAMVRATAREMAEEKGGKDASESDVRKEATRRINMVRIFGYAGIGLSIPLAVLAISIVFLVLGRLSRPFLRFQACFALAAHVWLPLALRHLMSIPVILSHPSLDPLQTRGIFRTDLGALLGAEASLPGLFLIDPFWIWMAVLASVAGRRAGWGRARSIGGGVFAWLILGFAGRLLA